MWNCRAAEGRAVRAQGRPAVRSGCGCSVECECPLLHSPVSSWAGPLSEGTTCKKSPVPFSGIVTDAAELFKEQATFQAQSWWCLQSVEFTASTPTVNIRIFNEHSQW